MAPPEPKPSKAQVRAYIKEKYGNKIKPEDLKIMSETQYLKKIAKRFEPFPFKTK